MITIKLDVENMQIEITGHAGAAPAGSDIVCAAVSTLAYTLAYNLQLILHPDDFDAHMEKGSAMITAQPPEAQAEQCRGIFMVIGNGLCMLADQYDQYMQIKGN